MARAAIYARFSSDLQRDRSIDDQIALCREYAARNGYEIVATFEDRALTGASIRLRHGVQSLLATAKTGAFEFVIAESLSRIARDQEDSAGIRKRLGHNGVRIVTPSDGVVSPLMHGLRTMIDSQFLEDLKGMIRRGMKGVVREGRHAGGRPYGYKTVPGKPGELSIDEDAAAIVRRIFETFAAGVVPRDIAEKLNQDRIPPPRGAYWRSSTITGDSKRQYGILRNRLYTGKNIWNRGHYVCDPDVGTRIRRPNPEADWIASELPHLRVVTDELFEAAQQRLVERQINRAPHNTKRPKRLLSGLLRCGQCGAGMSIKDHDHGRARLVCTQRREAGDSTCSHRRIYYADQVESLVIDGLRQQLGSREAISIFVRAYNDERQRLAAGDGVDRPKVEARLAAVERAIGRAVTAVIEERITDAEAEEHLPALRAERDQIRARLDSLAGPPRVVSLRQDAVATYLADIERLADRVGADLADGDSGASEAIRSIIETVTIVPTPAGQVPGLRVEGQIIDLLDCDQNGRPSGGVAVPGIRHHWTPRREALRFTLLLGHLKAA